MSTSTPTVSGSVQWSGIASGTDFQAVVDQLVAIEERVITRQQVWQSDWQAKLDSINQLNVRLDSLKMNAEDYDTRDEFLQRKAVSSDETVASIVNTSTAPLGVYEVEVGENIQERIASKTYAESAAIGVNYTRDSSGNYLNSAGNIIGLDPVADPTVWNNEDLIAIIDQISPGVEGIHFDGVNAYRDVDNNVIAAVSPDNTVVNLVSDSQPIFELNADGYIINARNDEIVPYKDDPAVADPPPPAGAYFDDLTITMGEKTLTLQYSTTATASDIGFYNPAMTMDELAQVINNTVASDPDNMPKIEAEILYDKTREDEVQNRLVINGLEGGLANHIYVNDPTNLALDRNSIDEAVTTNWIGSTVTPKVDYENSDYTGNTNKTVTVVATAVTGDGILGTDDITFSWADTLGNSGSFIVTSEDWDHTNNTLKESVELLQGVKVSFDGNPSGPNYMQQNTAFSIDCQAPVLQQAADSGLSQTDKWVHQGVASLTSTIHAGSGGVFSYYYAGEEYSVDLAGDVTLPLLVEEINSDPNNRGVTASILNDGMGTATSYKLVLTGGQAGQDFAIEISDSTNLSAMPTGPETWEQAREASNSMTRIDGYPNDDISWIQRPGNQVGDVIDGIVLELNSTGTTEISVTNDVTAMVDQITQLVESVNFCKSYIKEQTAWGGGNMTSVWDEELQMFVRGTDDGSTSGLMIGNYGFQISLSTLDTMMTKEIVTRDEFIKAADPDGSKKLSSLPETLTPAEEELRGPSQQALYEEFLETNGLTYTRLSDIGIASDPDNAGQYIVETSKLTEALNDDPEAVIKLFTFTPDATEFPYEIVYQDEEARPRIGGFATMLGYAMSDLTRTSDVIDSSTGEVIQGAKGICVVLAENYSNIISGIDDKIAREEVRIGMVRQRLEEKFTRLEVTLSQLNAQSSEISSQMASLSTGTS